LFRRTGEIVFVFSRPAGDMDLDGVQAAVLHPQAELFIDFPDAVLLEAIAHAGASAWDGHIAMFNAGYFGRRPRNRNYARLTPASRNWLWAGGNAIQVAGDFVVAINTVSKCRAMAAASVILRLYVI
jgi:hypothetical protein